LLSRSAKRRVGRAHPAWRAAPGFTSALFAGNIGAAGNSGCNPQNSLTPRLASACHALCLTPALPHRSLRRQPLQRLATLSPVHRFGEFSIPASHASLPARPNPSVKRTVNRLRRSPAAYLNVRALPPSFAQAAPGSKCIVPSFQPRAHGQEQRRGASRERTATVVRLPLRSNFWHPSAVVAQVLLASATIVPSFQVCAHGQEQRSRAPRKYTRHLKSTGSVFVRTSST